MKEPEELVSLGFDDHSTIPGSLDELNKRAETAKGKALIEIQDAVSQLTRLQGAIA